MRKVVLYIAISIDGYIARKDGDIHWLENPEYTIENESFGYNEFINSIDTTLMGNLTYQQVLSFDVPFPYPDTTNYVFTKSAGKPKAEFVEFIHEDIASFVKALKEQKGKDIWLIGGGQINNILLNEGLIDEIILTIIPVTLGEGIPLFSGKGQIDTHFTLGETKAYDNGFVQIVYTKRNS